MYVRWGHCAQTIIFGVFGVNVQPNGDIVIKPNQLPFASKIALKGLKIRGHSFDVQVDGSGFEVRTGDQTMRSTVGSAVVFSAANGRLQN